MNIYKGTTELGEEVIGQLLFLGKQPIIFKLGLVEDKPTETTKIMNTVISGCASSKWILFNGDEYELIRNPRKCVYIKGDGLNELDYFFIGDIVQDEDSIAIITNTDNGYRLSYIHNGLNKDEYDSLENFHVISQCQ